MKSLKVIALLFMVVFAAACSKTAPVAPTEQQGPAAIDVAAQQISDGIIYFDFDKYDIKDEYAEAGIVLEEYEPKNEDGVTCYTYTDEECVEHFVQVKENAVEEE